MTNLGEGDKSLLGEGIYKLRKDLYTKLGKSRARLMENKIKIIWAFL